MLLQIRLKKSKVVKSAGIIKSLAKLLTSLKRLLIKKPTWKQKTARLILLEFQKTTSLHQVVRLQGKKLLQKRKEASILT